MLFRSLNIEEDEEPLVTGFQGSFQFFVTGFGAGSRIDLCSTLAPPGPATTPCRWGGVDAGWVVRSSTLGQGRTSITLSRVALAEGGQTPHAEGDRGSIVGGEGGEAGGGM